MKLLTAIRKLLKQRREASEFNARLIGRMPAVRDVPAPPKGLPELNSDGFFELPSEGRK